MWKRAGRKCWPLKRRLFRRRNPVPGSTVGYNGSWSGMKRFIVLIILLLAGLRMSEAKQAQLEKATFAGGCFWCMEPPYKELKGVRSVTVGYTGGQKVNPTYEEVCSGTTGHAEAVEIQFDPTQTRYEELLNAFWHNID